MGELSRIRRARVLSVEPVVTSVEERFVRNLHSKQRQQVQDPSGETCTRDYGTFHFAMAGLSMLLVKGKRIPRQLAFLFAKLFSLGDAKEKAARWLFNSFTGR